MFAGRWGELSTEAVYLDYYVERLFFLLRCRLLYYEDNCNSVEYASPPSLKTESYLPKVEFTFYSSSPLIRMAMF